MLKEKQNLSTVAPVMLIPTHFAEWVKGSSVTEEIAKLNLKSIDNPVAIANLLNWQKYLGTGGWYVTSCNPLTGKRGSFGQFKPDQPIVFPNQEKPQKYFSFPKDTESEVICLVLTLNEWIKISERFGIPITNKDIDESRDDLGFWQWVLNHPEIPILITEGAKKAACLLSCGWVALALTGVWNGQKQKKLHPSLVPFVVPGRPIDLVFDADVIVKESVQDALRVLGHIIHRAKGIVRIVTWDLQLGKGCDDLIVAHGTDEFEQIMNDATPYSKWLKSLEQQFGQFSGTTTKKNTGGTREIPPADTVAHEIAAAYRDQLAFNNEIGRWMRYGADSPGMWSLETDEYVEAIVGGILDGKNITGYGSYSYLTNVVKTLRRLLIVRRWQEKSPKELLPFINGVLEVSTSKLLEHSPGYRLTWQLPRNHDPHATDWSTIDAYLDHLANGKAAIKEILLCFCNAVLTGRSDLQKFLHLIGLAGSGKGTFARLLTDLIGADNIYSGTLDDWCSNRFESANAYRKRLVVFWDEDKQSGKLGKFLSLTGGDWIRAEEKGKKAFQYRYDGMVAVLSNLPIFTGDAASRIARRVITIPCNSTVSIGQRRDLNAEFTPELDAFTNHVLSLPDAHVTQVLMGLVDIPECTLEFWENRIRTDSIAAWINDWVIYDVLAQTPIGSDRNEWEKGTVATLYGSYCLHCKQSGTQPKANKNFSPDLLELCRSVLGWEIERKVTKTGKFIQGLRLRTDGDFKTPTHDYLLMEKVKQANFSLPVMGDGLGDGSGDCSQPLLDKDFSFGDELALTLKENQESKLVSLTSEGNYQPEIDSNLSSSLNSLLEAANKESPPSGTSFVTNPISQSSQVTSQPTSQRLHELAALLIQCDTWLEIAQTLAGDGKLLMQAARTMTASQRLEIVEKLANYLCSTPTAITELAWIPSKLRDKVFKQLVFIIQQIGGTNIEDATIESISGCKFVKAEHLGTRWQMWTFQTPEGKNIPVFSPDAIEAIDYMAAGDG